MAKPIATKVYDAYGRFYDYFEVLFKKRLAKAIQGLPFHNGDAVLDVGIGTGLSLEFYPPEVKVTGIDLSEGMLQQAERKVQTGEVRKNCPRESTQLIHGNAMALPFPDGSFDAILLSHVVSTVPDPQKCLTEAFRVAREGACIAIVNHFRNPYPIISWVESAIDPICRKMGWRSDLSLEWLLHSLRVQGNARKSAKGFLFTIIYLQKHRGAIHVLPAREMLEQASEQAELGTVS